MNTIMFLAGIFIGFILIKKGAFFLAKFAEKGNFGSFLASTVLLWLGNISLSAFADFGLLSILVVILYIRLKHPGVFTQALSNISIKKAIVKRNAKRKAARMEKVGGSK